MYSSLATRTIPVLKMRKLRVREYFVLVKALQKEVESYRGRQMLITVRFTSISCQTEIKCI